MAGKGGTTPSNGAAGAAATPSTAYIPAEYLPNLRKYKYSGSDFSIMSRYVLQTYWNFVVGLVPMSVAPNRITFTGFILGMSSTVLLLYYYLFQNALYPSWVWYYTAFSLFGYQTLDAIDGKQARRTGAGSPLGELFDHGCDAFLTPFVAVNVVLAANMPPWMVYVYMMQSSLGLFTAIWEQFSTGTFDLGYLSGPTEGILLVCLIYITAGRYGTEVFDKPIAGPYEFTVPPNTLTRLVTADPVTVHLESARSFLLAFFLFAWFITVSANVLHALLRPTVHRTKAIPLAAAAAMCVAAILNALVYMAYPTAHDMFPFTFELSLGLLSSYTVTRMTICRLCVMPYSPFSFYYLYTVLAYVIILAQKHFNVINAAPQLVDTYVGVTMLILSLVGAWQYAHMIVVVFKQIAKYLNISIMTITPKKTD